MIKVVESELSKADIRKIEELINRLEKKVAENHWKRIATRACITVLVSVVVFFTSRSLGYTLIPVIAGGIWMAGSLDSVSQQKMQRSALASQRDRLKSPRTTVIIVEDCEYIDYGEFEDEGVLYLFFDGTGNWLMLEGQEYYETDSFPSKSFRISYDSTDALIGIESNAPYIEPTLQRDSSVKQERELYFLQTDHCLVQARDEEEAIAKIKAIARSNTT